ncbi:MULTISPECIES: hypothetical protein [unclassified Agromyces]|uniref:hypothetical protein n=1 Tax=unclassified Agromyces TaxID=2639701 RepID=UPI00301481EF
MTADLALAALRASRRAEALERELLAVRVLRVEVEQMRAGLLLDRLDGWHAGAAENYAGRVREIRVAIAGAEHLVREAEGALVAALDHARRNGAPHWAS